MMLLHSLGVFCLLVVAKSQFTTTGFGSCSRKCADDSKDLSVDGDSRFPCSCHPSCRIYKDCCYDSSYRNESLTKRGHYIQCLPLDGKGHFAAVGNCPKSWKESSQFCRGGFGHLPPVTSLKTGVTYTNLFCAICNEGSDSLSTWNVKTVCNKFDGNENERGRYTYRDRYLWRISIDKNNSVTQVPCKYVFHNGQEKSLNNFEMHYCRGQEIRKCSRTWHDNDVLNSCLEYLDPVYIGDKVYRNLHCATCNYEKEGDAHCIPSIVKQQQDMDLKGILEYCTKHNLGSCLDYLSYSKGNVFSFSEIFNIDSRMCIPAPGERCCEGYRYDFRRKRCRKLS